MVCIYCGKETNVFNSRHQHRNNQIWRRRRCEKCSAVFTTHEAPLLPKSFSVINDGKPTPFLPDKLFTEILLALQDRNDCYEAARELTDTISQKLLRNAPDGLILASNISSVSASVLKGFNRRAWLRYVSEHPSVQPKQ